MLELIVKEQNYIVDSICYIYFLYIRFDYQYWSKSKNKSNSSF